MTFVATLISRPDEACLTDRHLRIAMSVLPRATSRWLARNIAADVAFAPEPGAGLCALEAALRDALGGSAIDVVVQDDVDRRKRLLVADMDSTLIRQECIDELADAVGLRDEVAAITRRSVRGEANFDESLRERVAMLKGLDVAIVSRVAEERITAMPGAKALVATMRAHGAEAAIVSGGFTLFTAILARRLGIARHHANVLETESGRLTGHLRTPILNREAKGTILRAIRAELSISHDAVIAVGDGANDLDMLAEAGMGVAFHASDTVAAATKAKIVHGDLTALLYLQGYGADDFRA